MKLNIPVQDISQFHRPKDTIFSSLNEMRTFLSELDSTRSQHGIVVPSHLIDYPDSQAPTADALRMRMLSNVMDRTYLTWWSFRQLCNDIHVPVGVMKRILLDPSLATSVFNHLIRHVAPTNRVALIRAKEDYRVVDAIYSKRYTRVQDSSVVDILNGIPEELFKTIRLTWSLSSSSFALYMPGIHYDIPRLHLSDRRYYPGVIIENSETCGRAFQFRQCFITMDGIYEQKDSDETFKAKGFESPCLLLPGQKMFWHRHTKSVLEALGNMRSHIESLRGESDEFRNFQLTILNASNTKFLLPEEKVGTDMFNGDVVQKLVALGAEEKLSKDIATHVEEDPSILSILENVSVVLHKTLYIDEALDSQVVLQNNILSLLH